MNYTSIVISCLTSLTFNAQQINFETCKWNEIKSKATRENKLIFIDAYTSWCGPCKTMVKDVFTNTEVAQFYNANFINAKIDMEKGEGLRLAKTYSVGCYPSFLFIDGSGALVHRSAGLLFHEAFISLGKTALNPEQTYSAKQKKYDAGNREPSFITEYIQLTGNACLPVNQLAISYLSEISKDALLLEENWEIFQQFVTDFHSEPFLYVLNNREKFAEKFTEKKVNSKIFASYLDQAQDFIYGSKPDERAFKALRKEAKSLVFPRAEELILEMDLTFFESKNNWNQFYETSKKLIGKYKYDNSEYLNSISYMLYENSNNKLHLAEAEKWAKLSVEIQKNTSNLDTYACILYKNGKKQEAIEIQKMAIEHAVANGEDASELEKKLQKLKERM